MTRAGRPSPDESRNSCWLLQLTRSPPRSDDLSASPDRLDPRLSLLERGLCLFTEVRPGEGRTALLMMANVFLIMGGYYMVKPLREGWLAVSGFEDLSNLELRAYSSFAQGLLLVGAIAAYAQLVGRWRIVALVSRAIVLCMLVLIVFWALQPGLFVGNLPFVGVAFYLWVGIFGPFVVAQFWAFAASLYGSRRGKRLLPLLALGGTCGAVVGSWMSGTIVDGQLFPAENLLVVVLLPLAGSIVLARIVLRAEPSADPEPDLADPVAHRGSLTLVLRNRFLLAVAVATLLLNWVNTNGESVLFYLVQEVLTTQAESAGLVTEEDQLRFIRDGTASFYGNFFFWVNLVALLMQGFVASRLLKYGGFGVLFLLLPVLSLVAHGVMFLIPALALVKLVKVFENATDYSINNTARHVLWLPVPSEVKFKGKPTIDSLFARVGDGFAALTVLIGVQVLALSTELFFVFNVALVLVWFYYAVRVVREHRKLCEEAGIDARA